MKKILSFSAAMLLLLSTSCEKEKDIVLAEYVVGEWLTPTMYSEYISSPCHYEMRIKNDRQFSMRREETVWLNWPYTVDEDNSTITVITVDGTNSEITYSVTLTDDPDMMVWTTDDDGGETFLWQRGEVDITEIIFGMTSGCIQLL